VVARLPPSRAAGPEQLLCVSGGSAGLYASHGAPRAHRLRRRLVLRRPARARRCRLHARQGIASAATTQLPAHAIPDPAVRTWRSSTAGPPVVLPLRLPGDLTDTAIEGRVRHGSRLPTPWSLIGYEPVPDEPDHRVGTRRTRRARAVIRRDGSPRRTTE